MEEQSKKSHLPIIKQPVRFQLGKRPVSFGAHKEPEAESDPTLKMIRASYDTTGMGVTSALLVGVSL